MNPIAPSPAQKSEVSMVQVIESDFVGIDVHSKLNSVLHFGRVEAKGIDCIKRSVQYARDNNLAISICGGKHAMGGQQFSFAGLLIDMRQLNKVLEFDPLKGQVKVEAGITWLEIIERLKQLQQSGDVKRTWSIIQKPTGADDLSIGGSLSANIHGRGLDFAPFVSSIECFELIDAKGNLLEVSRDKNRELFRLAVGGFGLFGVVVSVSLRLMRTTMLKRHVEMVSITNLMERFEQLIEGGHLFGDCQFAIDNNSEEFLRKGILASYKEEIGSTVNFESRNRSLSKSKWSELLKLAHIDKTKAFKDYQNHYLSTNGQIYLSDTMQLSTYMDDYHKQLDKLLNCARGTEIITELYIPRSKLAQFMEEVRALFIEKDVDLIYGTIRLIKQDTETFLAWAKEDFACVIFNLHTDHGANGIAKNAIVFRQLIKIARILGGSFYLTYHRYVDKEDLDLCYPGFESFLKKKIQYDPDEVFQSQWYRHYRDLYKLST